MARLGLRRPEGGNEDTCLLVVDHLTTSVDANPHIYTYLNYFGSIYIHGVGGGGKGLVILRRWQGRFLGPRVQSTQIEQSPGTWSLRYSGKLSVP